MGVMGVMGGDCHKLGASWGRVGDPVAVPNVTPKCRASYSLTCKVSHALLNP